MDKTQKHIYQTLSRHMMEAAEELRYSKLFEEQEYYLLAIKEILVILNRKDLPAARQVRQARIVIEDLCPHAAEDMEDVLSALEEMDFE